MRPRAGRPPLVAALEDGGVLDALQAAIVLRRRPAEGRTAAALLRLVDEGDPLARIAACYALGAIPGPVVDRVLLRLLEGPDADLGETAALALATRPAFAPARAALRRTEGQRGFAGMLAGLALENGPRTERPLPLPRGQRSGGLRIAQVFLQGRIDGALRDAGAGDGGGLATLVVHLARALGRRPEIDHAVTITRAFHDEHAVAANDVLHEPLGEGAAIERIAFGPEGYLATADMWKHRAEAERALERCLRRLGPLDAVHLRFADVGTLAAARVCRRLGLPICFTVAADPHALIRARERSGALDRASFAAANRDEHLLFRIHLVESMLGDAAALVRFPRADGEHEVAGLLGLRPGDPATRRLHTVAEGISLETLDAAARARLSRVPRVSRDLRAAVDPGRAELPLLLSVGRFHRVKGFDRLAEAWAGDPWLRASFNLAIVGGNLARPTDEERQVMAALAGVVARHPEARDGLLLLGHRTHAEVATLLHDAHDGLSASVAPNGVYACASEKEEFGLALLEALAVGLPVVAPLAGGPATYVEDGETGFLVDTTSIAALRRGLRAAASIRTDAARAARSSTTIRARFSIDAMAAELAAVYGELAAGNRLARVA